MEKRRRNGQKRRNTDEMLGNLGINVPDLRAAKAYYDRLVPLLGFRLAQRR